MSRFASRFGAMILPALLVAAIPAAAQDFVLAASAAHKMKVIADGGPRWCGASLKLRMLLDRDSPDIGNPAAQLDLLNRLKTPIANACAEATSADATVIESGKPQGTYRAAK